jgi:hypothetical protein
MKNKHILTILTLLLVLISCLCSSQICFAGFFLGGTESFDVDGSFNGSGFHSFAGPVDRTIGAVRFEASGGAFVSPSIATPYFNDPTRPAFRSQSGVSGTLWITGEVNPDLKSDTMVTSFVDGGFETETERAEFFRVVIHPELAPIATAPLRKAMASQNSLTSCRENRISDRS